MPRPARDYVAKLQAEPAKIASRKASQNALNAYGPHLPELLGGSADLAPSNLTIWSGSTSIKEDPAGNYIHYGVREFGMTAVANGIALHGGFIPYTSTFPDVCGVRPQRRAHGGPDEGPADHGLYP
ncbi:Transketolase [Klebsiella aerogenes]|nr:Transketolase [Klebsiella aerogenes]